VRNPAFDVTPARFVSALITEKGVSRDPEECRIMAALDTRE
jgi:methylthioribose-1-phosphate isomerase